MTNREIIASVRKGINESSADSTYTNKFIYSKIKEQGKWLIVREARSGKLYKGTSIFQTAKCIPVIKVPATSCCTLTTCCKLYRTRNRIDELWEDINGPIVKFISSIDGSTRWTYISALDWQRKNDNPYNKLNKHRKSKELANYGYVFFEDGYFWFPERGPKKVNIQGYYVNDISGRYACDGIPGPCVKFLDGEFLVPDYLVAELVSKTLQELTGTKRIPEDVNVNKDPNKPN